MYCPSCGTQNTDNASFCRGCGANISLVPQALTGHLPPEPADANGAVAGGTARRGKHERPPTIESAVVPFFGGLAFLLVAFALAFTRMGHGWWFWMFIPAFFMMGGGVSGYLKLKQHERRQALGFRPLSTPTAVPPAARDTGALPSYDPPAGYTPGSVTDGTTRLLEQDRKQ